MIKDKRKNTELKVREWREMGISTVCYEGQKLKYWRERNSNKSSSMIIHQKMKKYGKQVLHQKQLQVFKTLIHISQHGVSPYKMK